MHLELKIAQILVQNMAQRKKRKNSVNGTNRVWALAKPSPLPKTAWACSLRETAPPVPRQATQHLLNIQLDSCRSAKQYGRALE